MEAEIVFSRIERFGAMYAEITLNRPEKGNALTMQMLRQLELLDQVKQESGKRESNPRPRTWHARALAF